MKATEKLHKSVRNRNQLPSEVNFIAAKCGNCGGILFPEGVPAAKTNSHFTSPSSSKPSGSNSCRPQGKSNSGIGATLGPAVIVFFGWLAFGAAESQDAHPESTTATQATANLPPPVTQAPGIMWNKIERPSQAPLNIKTSHGADYYVKLVDTTTGTDAMALYVSGGELLEVYVPLGSYHFRYATGVTWRGEQALFDPETSIYEAGEVFDFIAQENRIIGHTVELIKQPKGNLSTHQISRSKF